MKLSEHISMSEATASATAEELGLSNKPNVNQLAKMTILAEVVFEPLRTWANEPIRVNSFFRSEEVNLAVNGSRRSQHCKGEAIDISSMGEKTNKELFDYIKNNLDFDQLIWEFGSKEEPDWIHVSYKSSIHNRQQILKAKKKKDGSTYYQILKKGR